MKKNVNNEARGPQRIIYDAAQEVSTMEELRSFWERFSNTSLLMAARTVGDPEPIKHLVGFIYDTLQEGYEKVDTGAVCRTFSLHWDRPKEALYQMINFRRIFDGDEETLAQLDAIQAFLKKHTCKDISPGRYSRNDDFSAYIEVGKEDIELAIKELTARKQPVSSRMIKQFLYESLPFVSVAK